MHSTLVSGIFGQWDQLSSVIVSEHIRIVYACINFQPISERQASPILVSTRKEEKNQQSLKHE